MLWQLLVSVSFITLTLQTLSAIWFLKYQVNLAIRSFKNSMIRISFGINYFFSIWSMWSDLCPFLLCHHFISLPLPLILFKPHKLFYSCKMLRFFFFGQSKGIFNSASPLECSSNNFCKDSSFLPFMLNVGIRETILEFPHFLNTILYL